MDNLVGARDSLADFGWYTGAFHSLKWGSIAGVLTRVPGWMSPTFSMGLASSPPSGSPSSSGGSSSSSSATEKYRLVFFFGGGFNEKGSGLREALLCDEFSRSSKGNDSSLILSADCKVVTDIKGLGGSLVMPGVGGIPGVGGKGFSKYMSMISSTLGVLGVAGRECEGGHGLSMPSSEEDDVSRGSDGRAELDRDDILPDYKPWIVHVISVHEVQLEKRR